MSAGGSGTWQPLPGADAVGGEDPFAGDCFDPTEQRQRQEEEDEEEEEEEEEEGLSRPRGGALDWNLVHLGVSKEVHDRGKGEQLRAAGSIRNRKPHAIRAAVRYVASHQGSARELFCSFRHTAICGARWKEIEHDDGTWSLYAASVVHSPHGAATQKVWSARARLRARARTRVSTAIS